GSGVIFTITMRTGGLDAAQIALFDLRTRAITPLMKGGTSARYLGPGYLVYALSGTLRAIRFDLARRQTHGAPVVVANGARTFGNGGAIYALSDDGTLAYATGSDVVNQPRSLVWLDAEG